MNKKMILAGIAFGMAFAGALNAEEKVQFVKQESPLNEAKILNAIDINQKANLVFQPDGGVEGGCYKATKAAGIKRSMSIAFAKTPQMNISNTAAPVSMKLQIKGKGNIRLSFLCYNKARRYFYQLDKPFRKLDTKGEWQTVEFVFTPSPKNSRYLAEVAYVMPTLMVDSGEFLIDNWLAEVKNPTAEIKLED